MQLHAQGGIPFGDRILPSEKIQKIAVFRALQLGDMLCAVPALRALRHAAPRAHISLIGLPWAATFASRFDQYIDDFIEFPGFPGLPESVTNLRAIPQFLSEVQAQNFDLIIQMHGSGGLTNPLIAAMAAKHHAGFCVAGQYCPQPGLFLAWSEQEHEILRYLGLMHALGAPEQGTHLEFPLYESDRCALQQSSPSLPPPGAYACIHPGSQLPSRRWSPQRFAEVADRLAALGLNIVLTGTGSEALITSAVREAMHMPALDLTGKTELGALAALIKDARLLVCNDTGVSHIAAALATPSVVICSGADPTRFAPLDRRRHRVLHYPIDCRPCMHKSCPLLNHPCAQNISADLVWEEAVSVLTEQGYAGTLPGTAYQSERSTPPLIRN